jgi:hypothetical protein
MTETVKYKGLYKDSFGTLEIDIEDDFNMFSMEIDGVDFSGLEYRIKRKNKITVNEKT